MKEFKYTIDGKIYEVVVGETTPTSVALTVNGESYNVALEPKKVEKKKVVVKAPVAAPAPKPASANGELNLQDALKSPLPGVIQDVCVAVGDVVEEGQTLVVLEAMKMANNLDAEKSGKVTAVLVETGQSVMENTPLVVIE